MAAANRGDIYLVSLDSTAGHEQRGSRPALVVSPIVFNEASQIPIVLLITNGGELATRLGFAVNINSIETESIVRCDQPKAPDLSWRAKHAKSIHSLSI